MTGCRVVHRLYDFARQNWAILWMSCHSTASVCGYFTRQLVKAKEQIVKS